MSSSRTADVWIESGCNLACAVCDCRQAAGNTPESLERTLAHGGARLEIRGEAAVARSLADTIARARAAGWARIAVRTNGTGFGTAERARGLRDAGVDEVVFFLSSERATVHDAIARVRGAHAAALRGARALAAAGLTMVLELPVLSPKLQDLVATLELAAEATGAKRLRLYSPTALWEGAGPPARELLPPRWSEVRGAVHRALDRAEQLGIAVAIGERDGIPLCGVLEEQEVRAVLPERDQRPLVRGRSSRLGARCAECASRTACPGVTELYLSTHGDSGLEPRATPARDLVRRKIRPDSVWDDRRRASAKGASLAVIRPTVDCNQDCWFCSANETSRNVERDASRMARRIVRLARTGATHLSFSGGEPTLSRHLLDHVALAKAAGFQSIEIVTNATLLDREEKVDAYARAGLTSLFVSLHGHDEATSRAATRKVGDHAKTTRALQLFAERTNVLIRLNHVVSARNYRSLVRFVEWVAERFGTRVSISFAYLTPQYKALERLGEVLPTYTEAMPYLRKALARAAELRIECVVGARQGVPPCQLGEFAVFSDLTYLSSNSISEDAPQKVKAPACSTCRFDDLCTGVWRPYAELNGLAELVPFEGPKIGWRDDVGSALGVLSLPASHEIAVAPEPAPRRSLDVLMDEPRARLRVALVGTGSRAMRIARAAGEAGLVVVGVASPHAHDKELPELTADTPRAASLEALLREATVEAVIVASSTRDHAASARTALSHGLPVLVEKPVAADGADARALVEEGGVRLGVAHQMRMAGGFQELLRESKGFAGRLDLRVRHRVSERSPDSLHTWSRGQLFESMIHLLDLVVAVQGTEVTIERARGIGTSRPDSIELSGHGPHGRFSVVSEPRAAEDSLEVEVILGPRRVLWSRRAGGDEVTVTDAQGARSRSAGRGSDLVRLLSTWAASIRDGAAPPVTGPEGEAAMRLAGEVLRLLEAADVAFDRANAPRHASSRELRERYD